MGSFRRLRPFVITLAAIAATAASGISLAQSSAPPKAAAASATPDIEPGVMDELSKMGAYLRSLPSFTLQVEGTKDEVLLNGQKIQFGGKLTYKFRKPDGLYLNQDTDRQQRQFYFNGKTFTLYSPRMHYYATVPAPATVAELIGELRDKFDIELPVSDLFTWGTDAANTAAIKNAIDVGPARINGAMCEQLAFRQDGVDWQIWIQQGDKPLPRKLVITTTDDDAKPEYQAVFTWESNAKVTSADFNFSPPKDAHRINFAGMSASEGTAKENSHVQ